MGLGHVPAGSLPRAREGADVPRRQRRGTRTARAIALGRRPTLGRWGETLACWYLEDHGLQVVTRNVSVNGGEIDLLVSDAGALVAVEVRTITAGDDPIDAVGPAKRARVRALATRAGAHLVDFVGIRVHGGGVDVHWVPE